MINLLPPSYKEELEQEKSFRLLVVLGISFFIFLICFMLMLFALRIYLKDQIESEKLLSFLSAKELQSQVHAGQNLLNANNDFTALFELYQKRLSFSLIADHIANDLPQDIFLENLDISSSGVVLSGFAPKRDTLFAFKEKLGQDSLFQNINFPLSNLVNAQNINFSIRMGIRKNK